MKSCEGASIRHHSHQALALTQLISILIVYCSSGLYVFLNFHFIFHYNIIYSNFLSKILKEDNDHLLWSNKINNLLKFATLTYIYNSQTNNDGQVFLIKKDKLS